MENEQLPFIVGDVVALKSGGPAMTIHAPGKTNKFVVVCMWFDGREVRSSEFDMRGLEKAEKSKAVAC